MTPPARSSSTRVAVRWIAVAVFAAVQIFLALDDTPTADEPRHLRDGVAVLRDGRIDVNPEHPPLVKLLAAAALPPSARTPVDASRPPDPAVDDARFAVALPFRGATQLRARLPGILVATAGLIAFGSLFSGIAPNAAAVSTILLAFAPMWLAQGHYVTTDMAPVAFLLMAAWAVRRFPTAGGGALSGVFLGAALASKFSAPLLAPFLLLWVLVRSRWRGLAAALAVALCVVTSVEAFAVRRMSPEDLRALSRLAFVEGGIGSPAPAQPRLQRIADRVSAVSRPLGAYAIGFLSVLHRSATAGEADYWAGRVVTGPQPLYPLESMAIKNDLPLLLAAALGAVALWTGRRGAGWGPPIAVSGGLVYLVAACRSSMHWGTRYLLPLVVLLAGLATAMLLRETWRGLLVALLVAHAAVAALAFPHFVTYRNAVARFVVSPGLTWDFGEDWGQDLGRALRSQKRPVRYFSLLHAWAPEWRELYPTIGDDRDDGLPWLVDRLVLDLADASRKPDVPLNARPQVLALQPVFERVDGIRKGRVAMPTSEPTLVLFESR